MQIQNKHFNVTDFKDRCTWYDFIWGKATIQDGVWQLMGRPESCKDYIIDAYHLKNGGVHLNRRNWTEEELQSPHLYVYPKWRGAKFLKGIKEFLNPYEIKHGFTPTTVEKGKYAGKTLYLITHDAKWCKTLAGRSYYYSLLRMCAYIDTQKPTTTAQELETALAWESSEATYINQDVQRYNIFYQNPTLLLQVAERDTYTGFPKDFNLGHGQSGLFWNLSVYRLHKRNSMYINFPAYQMNKHIFKILEEHNVQM